MQHPNSSAFKALFLSLLLLLLAACARAPAAAPSSNESVIQQPTPIFASADATQTALVDTVARLFEGTTVAGTATREFALTNPAPTATSDPDQDPAEAARRYLTAALSADGAALARYTCARDAEAMGMGGAFLSMLFGSANAFLSGIVPGAEMSIDLSDVTFTVTSQSGSQATVETYGEMTVVIGGAFQKQPVDGFVNLIYEGGRWRQCSG